jgi:hypothetical protein
MPRGDFLGAGAALPNGFDAESGPQSDPVIHAAAGTTSAISVGEEASDRIYCVDGNFALTILPLRALPARYTIIP